MSTQPRQGSPRPAIRALFFAPTLGGGGAEMQIVRLLNAFDPAEVDASVAVARGGGAYEARLRRGPPLRVGPRVRSSLVSVLGSVPGLVSAIRRLRPEVLVSVQEHTSVSLLVASRMVQPRPKLLLGIQNNLSAVREHAPAWARAALFPSYLRAYREADGVIALSRGVADDLLSQVPGISDRLRVVHNAGVDDDLPVLAREALDEPPPAAPLLVACGRLTPQKDFETLLVALSKLVEVPAPELWILGEGPERERLMRLSVALGVQNRVRFLGFRRNPYKYMAAADLFVLSSRWEGFANVVAEALACGTRVVSTDCPYGPAEILGDGEYGRLVPVGDANALSSAIAAMLATSHSARLAEACRERARRFGSAISAEGYADVIRELALQRAART